MSLDRDISYVYEKVFTKAHYDEQASCNVIKLEDYIHLNLTTKQLNILRKMCKNSGIKLETIEYKNPCIEDEKKFKEYNEIKKKLALDIPEQERKSLEERRIVLRNKIVTDNLAFVRTIINRNYDEINKLPNREEIYQIGYDVLFSFVDNLDIMYPKTFSIYISSKLIYEIKKKLLFIETGYNYEETRLLEKTLKSKSILETTKPYPTAKDLSQKTEIEEKRIKELLNLERLLSALNIDSEVERINNSNGQTDSYLYNDQFEKTLIMPAIKESIIKIIHTLPKQQSEVILLSFGFIDGRCYTDIEIADMLGVSNSRIGIIRHQAIDNLKYHLRSKYLFELSELDTKPLEKSLDKNKSEELEEVLLEHIPKYELMEYLNQINKTEKKIFMMYNGIDTEKKYNLTEIMQITGFPKYRTYKLKKDAYNSLRKVITEKYFQKPHDTIPYEKYLEFLIENYVMRKPIKRR